MQNEYEIEIVETNIIDGGIEVFARAWKNGVQIGFGDGTVDVERFRINISEDTSDYSWMVVPDELGTIEIDESYLDVDRVTLIPRTGKYREDPEAHMQMFITNVIASLPTHGDENIIAGKVGNTVTTFTPNSSDGVILNSGTVWSTVRTASSGTGKVDTATDEWLIGADKDGTTYNNEGFFMMFDTSSLPDGDTISSATITIRQTDTGEGARSFGLTTVSPASNTALVLDDYDQRGYAGSEGASRVTMNTTNTTWTYTLNATGLSWISKTGYSRFGLCAAGDIDNTTPTARNYSRIAHSENTTAAYRPTLSVTHSAATSTFIPRISFIM